MDSAKSLFWQRILIAVLLAGAFSDAEAKPRIDDVLAKGSKWTLNVDGEKATLTLAGGKGGQLSNGGFEVYMEVVWGGRKGILSGIGDAKRASQRVTLELTRKNGFKVKCHGFIAWGSDHLMAGTCNEKNNPGAWYATRLTATASDAGSAQCQKDVDKYKHKLKACNANLKQERDRYKNDTTASKKKPEHAKGKRVPFSTVDQHLIETFQDNTACPDCKSNVPEKDFPEPPPLQSELSVWLRAHGNDLLGIVAIVFPGDDNRRYGQREQEICRRSLLCEIAVRQEAIAYQLRKQ